MRNLIKPIVTEKTNKDTEVFGRYAFYVEKKANKLEIKKEIEKLYNVNIVKINTSTESLRKVTRYTKAGYISGAKKQMKKAFVQLKEGQTLDLYAS